MQTIPISNLFVMLLPLIFVGYFYFRWVEERYEIAYASLRMVVQLILIGFGLTYLFENDSTTLGVFVILFIISISSIIALRNITLKTKENFMIIFLSIAIGGSINLFLVIKFVLELTPFYQPKYVIPIAGMIYANAMNSLSLVAERFEKEIVSHEYIKARQIAFKSSMIPQINSFLAVGLVSLPGMMTGQILSGVDPLIAIRYQIVVMAMILGSSGITNIIYLQLKNSSLKK